MKEVYAGFVSFTDHHFGRVIEFLEELNELGYDECKRMAALVGGGG